jgi:nicotinate-nucleotide pyrophosphorylase (carboxylating)
MTDTPLLDLVDRALAEDVGDGDVTAQSVIPADARALATITQKQPGVLAGIEAGVAVFRRLDPSCEVESGNEGVWGEPGTVALRVTGSARALLTAERTALNLMQRLSGVATQTAQVVRAVRAAGGTATILDTRKTTPGMRLLEKRAVELGGATNHRMGLYDAIMVKENHAALGGGIEAAVAAARKARPDLPVTVEVRDEAEIDQALAASADRLLLDNMTPEQVAAAVARVDGRAEIEASGGITPETVSVYATIKGLDFVSIGWLTHSAPALDLSLALEELPS